MEKLQIIWMVFWVTIISALIIDFIILNQSKYFTLKKALKVILMWISLALAFNILILFTLGMPKALEFFTGYIIEYSLSVDNMFVFVMIFTYFNIKQEHQPKILLWGVLGAIVMRFIFIFMGIKLINTFDWIIYIFGTLLIVVAIKMFFRNEQANPSKNIAFIGLKKIVPFDEYYKGKHFFIKKKLKYYATPLLAALIVVEMADVIFAVDSIPAILAITKDPLIVYSSNVFALIGLRSLYFFLANMKAKFEYLKYAISIILVFVGIKLLLSPTYHIPTLFSLMFILFVLSLGIFISIMRAGKR